MTSNPHQPSHPHLLRERISFASRLRAYFFAGVLVTAPVTITFYLGWLIISLIDDLVVGFIPERFQPLALGVPGIGLVLIVVALILVGWFAAGFVGRLVVRTQDRLLARMPLVRSVYGAVKQILETVLAQTSTAFRDVVLIEYPRRGIWAVGFITGRTEGEVQNLTEDECVNIFLPTTPNPTSGFLLFVPKKDLVKLDMSVEEGIKMVVSGGIVTPPDRRPPAVRELPQISSRLKGTDRKIEEFQDEVAGRDARRR